MLKDIDRYNKNIELILNKNNYFDILRDKSILITGANGLIASSVIDVLNWLNVNRNYNIQIKALVRNKKNLLERFKTYSNFEVIEQDIINPINYKNDIDYIIHAASNSNPKLYVSDPVGTMLGNFVGMNNALEFAINHNCKRVEYISSGEIYGQGSENIDAFDEEYWGKITPTNSRSCYPLSKLASETLCVSYSEQYNIETVIARPCHCYGPTQTEKDNRVSAQFINNVLNNQDIVMKSEGLQVRSYCYVVDCAIGVLTILVKGENNNAYNIANNNSILSIKEMAEIIAQKANKQVVFELPDDLEKRGYNPVTRSVLNGEKLEKIGWIPCWNFNDGIEETLKIMKE
jgi:nucleoside-diphosphate-sugar epimerase